MKVGASSTPIQAVASVTHDNDIVGQKLNDVIAPPREINRLIKKHTTTRAPF